MDHATSPVPSIGIAGWIAAVRRMNLTPVGIVFIVLTGLCLCSVAASGQRSWKKIGDISEARFFFNSYPISQSEVLIVGGHPGGMAVLDASATCDILDVDRRTIVRGPRMNVPHAAYSSLQMPDGSIIVIGGLTGQEGGTLVTTDTIERFDPIRRTWNVVGRMRIGRMHTAAVALDSHRILIVGGRLNGFFRLAAVASCEIFDLRTGQSTEMPKLPVVTCDGSAVRTKAGQILAFGGREGGPGSQRSPFVYQLDTTLMKWRVGGDFPTPFVTSTALKLTNGDVMVAGGSYRESNLIINPDILCDGIFRWNGNTFDSIGAMRQARVLHRVMQYDDSTLLVVGGKIPSKVSTSTCEWIDVRTGRATSAPDMSFERAHVSLIVVERKGTKRAFAIGGITGSDDVATTVVEELVSCDQDTRIAFGGDDAIVAGGAKQSGDGAVVLTETQQYSVGAVWGRKKVDVTGGFTVSFSFRMTDGHDNEQPDGSLPGADGVVFVVQNSGLTALGKSGEGIGYEGMQKALAVEFDTYLNPAYSDPNGNHIAVQSGGLGQCRPEHMPPYILGITTDIVTMIPDGSIYHGRISYQGNRLGIYLDTTGRFERPALVLDSVDIPTLLGLGPAGAAWIGFTSATGKSVERHELLSWDIDGCTGLVTSVHDDAPGREDARRTYIAPMPSHDVARLFSTEMSGETVTVVLHDVWGTTLGTTTIPAYDLVKGIDLPFRPSTGSYYVRIVDAVRSITIPWVVIR